MTTADDIIEKLNLQPHPGEGGFFVETYRSKNEIQQDFLPLRYKSERAFSTAIYYLITSDSFSGLHKLQTDEIFHFYLGAPLETLLLYPNGESKIVTIGNDLMAGHSPQVVVPRDVWQGSYLPHGEFALLGTTMSPGFDIKDFEIGQREILLEKYPTQSELIKKLTR